MRGSDYRFTTDPNVKKAKLEEMKVGTKSVFKEGQNMKSNRSHVRHLTHAVRLRHCLLQPYEVHLN